MVRWAGLDPTGSSQYQVGAPRPMSWLGTGGPDWSAFPTAPPPAMGRPYQDVGKLQGNLLEPGTFFGKPPTGEVPAAPGIVPSILGGIGEFVGGAFGKGGAKLGHDIMFGVGDVLDTPLDIASSLPASPILPFGNNNLAYLAQLDDKQKQALVDELKASSPFDALSIMTRHARMRYEQDVEAGRIPRLLAPFAAPMSSIGEQFATMLSVLALPEQAVERTFAGATGRAEQVIGYKGTDPLLTQIAAAYRHGDYGQVGSSQARDRVLDELTAGGRGFTNDGLANMVFAFALDPLVWGGFGAGKVALAARAAEAKTFQAGAILAETGGKASEVAIAGGRFLEQFPMAERPGVLEQAIHLVADREGLTAAQAADRMVAQPIVGIRAFREVAKAYPEQLSAATKSLSYMERFATTYEPAMRPVLDIVRKLNDPITFFGKGAAGRAANNYLSSGVTEGVFRAFDMPRVVGLLDEAGKTSKTLRSTIEQGLGVYAHNVTLWVIRRRIVRDVKGVGVLPGAAPGRMVADRLAGLSGSDLSRYVEMFALRVMPRYLARGRGLGEAALNEAREQAAKRIVQMDPATGTERATALASRMDRKQVAAIDAAYYGHAVTTLHGAMAAARNAGEALPADFDRLTIIGSRELTKTRARELLAAIDRGDIDAVRQAVSDYDLLFENLSDAALSPEDLVREVRELLTDHEEDLVQEITDFSKYPAEVQDWVARNADIGYRLGIAPAENRRWRAVVKDQVVKSVNPWLDASSEMAAVPRISALDAARDRLFHNIRGERIVEEAKQRFASFTSDRFGMTRHEADGVFARLMQAANEEGVTPRGMNPERIYHVVMTHHLSPEVAGRMEDRDAVAALLLAFEGNFWTVGASQKFTGVTKTGLAGRSNFVGQVAERVYPLVRFTLNPIFQMQEAVEPYILNIQRGVKPGFRPSDMDRETLVLAQHLMRDSRYALDDMIEFGDMLLWGEIAAKDGFGPQTRLARITKAASLGGMLNIKRMKQVNYARLTRRLWGDQFYAAINRINPALWPELTAIYKTADRGAVALRYMTDRAIWTNANPKELAALARAIKPGDLGALVKMDLEDVASVLRANGIDVADGAALKQAIRDGTLTAKGVERTILDFGGDPEYARRASIVAAANYTVDDWFDAHRVVFDKGNHVRNGLIRRLYENLAAAQGTTLEEYLDRRFRDVPMSADAATFGQIKTPADMAALRLHGNIPTRIDDLNQPFVREFRSFTRGLDHEWALAWDPDTGKEIFRKEGMTRAEAQAMGYGGVVSFSNRETAKFTDKALMHSHPFINEDMTFSTGDLAVAAKHNLAEIRAESPGFSYVIRRRGDFWSPKLTVLAYEDNLEGMRDVFGDYLREWYAKVDAKMPDIENPVAEGRNLPQGQALQEREAQDYAMRKMAEQYGFDYHAIPDPYLSDSDWMGELQQVADNPPEALAQHYPELFHAEYLEPVDFGGRQVLLPGGLRSDAPFTYWEQQLLKAQGLSLAQMWDADPIGALNVIRRVWAAKEKDPTDVLNVFDSMAFAGLTGRANLTVTSAAYSRIRPVSYELANQPLNNGARMGALEEFAWQAQTWEALIPEALRHTADEAEELGRMFQFAHGYYRGVEAPGLPVSDPGVVRMLAEKGEAKVRAYVDGGMDEYDAYLKASEDLLPEADAAGVVLFGRSWGGQVGGGTPGNLPTFTYGPGGREVNHLANWMVGTKTNFRAQGTNAQWGNILQWSLDLLTDGETVRWMQRQPFETATSHAMRLAAVSRGLSAKTALLAMSMMGPKRVMDAPIDTVIARLIAKDALERGELDALTAQMTEGYRNRFLSSVAEMQAGAGKAGLVAFPTPAPTFHVLWKDGKEAFDADRLAAIQTMRQRLAEVIPDPDERALYDREDVLAAIAYNSSGRLPRMGGDYALMNDYLAGMKAREAEQLGVSEIGELSNAEYQWLRWDRERNTLDPHEIMTMGVERVGSMPDRMLAESIENLKAQGYLKTTMDPLTGVRVDPRLTMLLQKVDNTVMGANVYLDDGQRIIVATQHADARTGLHELAHVFMDDLDPSLQKIIADEFRKATGTNTFGRVTRPAAEWFADQFPAYLTGTAPSKELRGAFAYFGKWLGAVYTTIKHEEENVAFRTQRKEAVRVARETVTSARQNLRKSEVKLGAAQRRTAGAANAVRAERSRATLDVLQGKFNRAQDKIARTTEALKQARGKVRASQDEVKFARAKVATAENPHQKGGFIRTVGNREAALDKARMELKSVQRDLAAANRAKNEAGVAYRAAKRRTSMEKVLKTHADAVAAQKAAGKAYREARDELDRAQRNAERVAQQREPAASRYRPTVSPAMKDLFDQALTPKEIPVIPKRHAFGTYDPQEETVYAAAEMAFLKAEEEAFTTHYYKRGRNWLERSANHPYFGLYPFSYMWSKMLPEMIRFLVKEPFGIPAPFAALSAANNVYRGVMLQKEYDPNFRDMLTKNEPMFRFISMLIPASPWEIPVNAPLWARRMAEQEAMNSLRQKYGMERKSMTPEQYASVMQDVATYAFGPAYAFQSLGGALGILGQASNAMSATLQDSLGDVFGGGQQGLTQQPLLPPGARFGS